MNSNSHASLLLSATELAKSFKEAKQAYYAEQNRCTTEIVALEKALQSQGVDHPFYLDCDDTLDCDDGGSPVSILRLEWSRHTKSDTYRLQYSLCHFIFDEQVGDVFPMPGESKPLAEAGARIRMKLHGSLPAFIEAFKANVATGKMFMQNEVVINLH